MLNNMINDHIISDQWFPNGVPWSIVLGPQKFFSLTFLFSEIDLCCLGLVQRIELVDREFMQVWKLQV